MFFSKMMIDMGKKIRRCLIAAAGGLILIAGGKIRENVQPKEETSVAMAQMTGDGSGQVETFHTDILMYELLMVGSGYLLWAAASWNGEGKKEKRYSEVDKGRYVIQE